MSEKIIGRQELNSILDNLLSSGRLIAPVEEDGLVLFRPVTKGEGILLDYINPVSSTKEFFLPSSQSLFKFGEEIKGEVETEATGKVIFGMRPCDAKGLTILNKVFQGEYEDSHFLKKREMTTLVGLSCPEPDRACFCTSQDCSPHSSVGLDALVSDLEDGNYYLEILTKKGEGLFGQVGSSVTEELKEKKTALDESRQSKIRKRCEKESVSEETFHSPYWGEVSRSCLSCGICAFLCPTCHCFGFSDEVEERYRYWDSCCFKNYTLMTSGENPRRDKSARYRQRVYHKFNYFIKNFGEKMCVGCGRCIRYCPVSIDIAEIVTASPEK